MNFIIRTLFNLFGKRIDSYGKYTIIDNSHEVLLIRYSSDKYIKILDYKELNSPFSYLTLSQKQPWDYSKKFKNSITNRKIN